MSEFHEQSALPDVVSARSSQRGPMLFNIFTMIAILLPFPLMIFWLGASMVLYAMNRHHPNPKVGHYIQQAAYRLYGVTGMAVPVGTFFGLELMPWLIYWVIAAVILIPWSILDLMRIKNDDWEETTIVRNEA